MSDTTASNTRALLGYLFQESGILRSPLLIYVVIASASRTGLIFLINETAERGGATWGTFFALLAVAGVMLGSLHLSTMGGVKLVQRLALKMRVEIADHLLRADVGFFQTRDPITIHHHATHHVDMVSGATMRLADAIQAILLLCFVIVYMVLQMPASVLATVIALVLGVVAFFANEGPATRAVAKSHEGYAAFHGSLNDILRGYKELRLRRSRRSDLADRIGGEIADLQHLVEKAERHYSFGHVTANGALSALLISVVVLLPLVAGADSVTMLQILTLVLFSFGPIEAMISGLPALARAGVSYRIYRELGAGLEDNSELPDPETQDRRATFETLEMRDVMVELTRDVGDEGAATDRFTLGPVNLTLRPGQSVFITGGNGMGKSTLLGLLTGLRHPDSGQILIDGTPVNRANISEYRSVFSAVFSEFYLFRKLYGLSPEAETRLVSHIDEMGLGDG
ncbi:MAG: ATP-binding cassette domain-containing protein, partial [Pseudomonadota bacterium]